MSMDQQPGQTGTGSPKTVPGVTSALLEEHIAAAFLGYTVRALRNWRYRGGGPRYIKVSEKSIRYQLRDLQAWIDARICDDTAVAKAGSGLIKPRSRKQCSHSVNPDCVA